MLIIHHTLHNNRKKVLIVQHTLENRPKNEILPYTRKANKNEPLIRFVFSYLWFATGLVTMQCIVCTLRVPLHAVQLAQRFASKLARLCYYARFAHYKSFYPHHQKALKTLSYQGFFFFVVTWWAWEAPPKYSGSLPKC